MAKRDIEFSDEQQQLLEIAENFCRDKSPVSAVRAQIETEDGFDPAIWQEMCDLGWLGIAIPEEYGGLGASSVTAGVIIDEIAYGDFPMSYVQLVGGLLGDIVAKFGAKELAAEWVPKIIQGEALIGLGLTEPRGGSDAALPRCTAEVHCSRMFARSAGDLLMGNAAYSVRRYTAVQQSAHRKIVCVTRERECIYDG